MRCVLAAIIATVGKMQSHVVSDAEEMAKGCLKPTQSRASLRSYAEELICLLGSVCPLLSRPFCVVFSFFSQDRVSKLRSCPSATDGHHGATDWNGRRSCLR